MRNLFSVRESGGYQTNRQLYAYRQALTARDELRAQYAVDGETTEQLREKRVFAVAALGLSVSQLLGQNNPEPRTTSTPSPKALFSAFVTEHGLDASLLPRFNRFIDFYDGIRHFGITTDDSKYALILKLDCPTTQECFDTGIEVWKQVVEVFARDPGAQLSNLDPEVHAPDDEEYYVADDA